MGTGVDAYAAEVAAAADGKYLQPRPATRAIDAYFARQAADQVMRYRATPDGLGLAPPHERIAALAVRAWAETRRCWTDERAVLAAGELRGVLLAAHYLGYGKSAEALRTVVVDAITAAGPNCKTQIEVLAERLAAEAWT